MAAGAEEAALRRLGREGAQGRRRLVFGRVRLLEIAAGAGAPRGGTPVSAELEGIAEIGSEKQDGSRGRGGSSSPTRLSAEQTLIDQHSLQIGSGARHFNSTSFGTQRERSI
jgi:hypothetical protein